MKQIIKKLIIIILSILVITAFTILSLLIFDKKENIAIDEYNFKQLEKVREFLDNKEKTEYKFRNLNDFNKKYGLNIKPENNCYYMVSNNYFGDNLGGYIFGFKLESFRYRIIYGSKYVAYPKYNLSVWKLPGMNFDVNYGDFIETISNPCQD